MSRLSPAAAIVAAALAAAGCNARQSPSADPVTGPNPQLPKPSLDLLPPVKVFKPIGWGRALPTTAPDLKVAAFATGLNHPRWLYRLPNGDILVAESNGSPEPLKRPKDWVMRWLLGRSGAGVPSPNRIILLRDANNDGVAETRTVFLKGLNSPFGMTLVGRTLYVANTDALLRFPYSEGQTGITAAAQKVVDLPAGPIDHHWTKNVIASRDGSKLYVTVGSNSNVGENGMAAEKNRAAIWEVDPASGKARLFATGLRNPNGMDFEPTTGVLWTVANERDELGDNLVPDYLTSVKEGAFYGWPYSYYGQHVDSRVRPQRSDLVARAIPPDYALGPHVAPLGLTFYTTGALPARYNGGAFVGEHGSWNRASPNGYRVVFIPFRGGRPSGPPQTVLGGFISGAGAHGRPVGVTVDKAGALLVADDVGNTIWRVTAR